MYCLLNGKLQVPHWTGETWTMRAQDRPNLKISDVKNRDVALGHCFLVMAVVGVLATFLLLWMVNNYSDIWNDSDQFVLVTTRQWEWIGGCLGMLLLVGSLMKDGEFFVEGIANLIGKTRFLTGKEFDEELRTKTLGEVADKIYDNTKYGGVSFPQHGLVPQVSLEGCELQSLDKSDKSKITRLAAAHQKNLYAYWELEETLQQLPTKAEDISLENFDPDLIVSARQIKDHDSILREIAHTKDTVEKELQLKRTEWQANEAMRGAPMIATRLHELNDKQRKLSLEIEALGTQLETLARSHEATTARRSHSVEEGNQKLTRKKEELRAKKEAMQKNMAQLEGEWRTFQIKLNQVSVPLERLV